MTPGTTYELVRGGARRLEAPLLDTSQQAVVDHPGGPLLVLAGPGTGKTTTLVEAIVDRIERRGAAPESVLALTFSRKAAEQLRDRVTARLGRTMSTQLSFTFHSFAYGLVRLHPADEGESGPLLLLSAPEQDVELQELLTDAPESVVWPESVQRAVGTRGFAREVQAVLSRALEKGLDGRGLERLGHAEGVPEFVAAGRFLEQYLAALDPQGKIDYPTLVLRAVNAAEDHRDALRSRYEHVFVDEYQDTDPSQVALLQHLAGDGRNLVVVGDPHQSIYGFRGAEVKGILEFPTTFPKRSGDPADVVALRTTRRFGPRLLTAAHRIAGNIGLSGSINEDARDAFLNPEAAPGPYGDGRVDVLTFDTERAEAEHLADLLRRAHLEEDIGWSEMAVLVRSGRTSIPALRRSLAAAGVPVEVASDETPLVREPAVLPLLEGLRAAVNLDNTDPDHRDFLDAGRVESLLVSPLGGLDATEVRAVARALRLRARAGGEASRPSAELLREALLVPGALDGVTGSAAAKVLALAGLLRDARAVLDDSGTPEQVLWALWSGTSWSQRLRGSIDFGGAAARRAHRDLDAICALFETAAKAEERDAHPSVAGFLATLTAQDIPGDTLADRGVRGEAVRLLTAHRSKGLEWRLVAVAQVQEDVWPDLRRRSTLLQADRIGARELLPPVSARTLLAEERRLFYVACTRARQRLIVTAVASPEDDGPQPSRFLAELGVELQVVEGRPVRPLSMAGLVSELRRTVADPAAASGLRQAAAHRLARLAREEVRGRPVAPQADPASWWGTRAATVSDAPVRPPDLPVTLSASALTSLMECPAKWFLEREAGGSQLATQAQGFGLVVHAIAERCAKGDLSSDPADLDELMAYVDQVWAQIPFRTPWSGMREREEIRKALGRFLVWQSLPGARTLVSTEQQLRAEVTLPDGQQVALFGYADRIELDENGQVFVIDLKTSKTAPTAEQVKVHPQLGLYQLAVEAGALDGVLDDPAVVGGAELVQLRQEAYGKLKVQQQTPQQPDEDGHRPIELQLQAAASAIRNEDFPARAGKQCERCNFHAICPIQSSGTVLS